MKHEARLLDATLRDGGYCVDFQFTAADTAVIVGALDAAGVGFIELGHGNGTFQHKAPANTRSKTRQAARDEEYLAVARRCASRAKLGIITGTFGADDLKLLVEHRFDFVRLACMADRALDAPNLKMVEQAKALGLTFSVNLMQTVAITPARVAEIAVEYAKAGADWFYIVDSSGGLLPSSVSEYVARAHDASPMQVGFHAHHNSGLAIANCLAAIQAGATLVDGTLQGLGRDVGNAPTEQLLLMMQRAGYERGIDVEKVCHVGDLVRGLLLEKGNDPTYFASGSSEVHSSNVVALLDLAKTRGLGARSLLAAIGLGEQKLIGASMKTFPDEIMAPALARATAMADSEPRGDVVEVLADDIIRASGTSLPVLADVLFSRAAKWHMRSVLHLVPHDQFPFRAPLPWDLAGSCGFTVGVNRSELAGLDFGDRRPDVLVIDPALVVDPLPAAKAVLVDAFMPIVVDAALTLATICLQPGSKVWLACSGSSIAGQLAARADQLASSPGSTSAGPTVIAPTDSDAWLSSVKSGDTVIVVGHSELPSGLAALATRGARLLRPGIATGVAARITALLDLRARLAGGGGTVALVDPIFVPGSSQIVVDDVECPSTIVGGTGRGRADAISAADARARSLSRGRGRL